MNRIIPTALVAAAVATGLGLSPVAEAATVYIPGTRAIGEGNIPPDAEIERLTGLPRNEVIVVDYPRDLAPYRGTTPLDQSVALAVEDARPRISAGDTVVCYSQGCLAAEALNREPGAVPVTNINYGDPTNRDGGIVTKLPKLPTIPKTPATPDPTRTTYSIEYDVIADAPDRSIFENPLAWANSGLAFVYDHGEYGVDYVNSRPRADLGKDEYGQHYLVKQPNLPLTRPIRDVEHGLTRQTRVSDTLDRVLRPVVDSAYDNPKNVRNNVTDGGKVTPQTTAKKEAKDDDDTGTQRRDGAGADASGVSRDQKDDRPSDSGEGSGAGQD